MISQKKKNKTQCFPFLPFFFLEVIIQNPLKSLFLVLFRSSLHLVQRALHQTQRKTATFFAVQRQINRSSNQKCQNTENEIFAFCINLMLLLETTGLQACTQQNYTLSWHMVKKLLQKISLEISIYFIKQIKTSSLMFCSLVCLVNLEQCFALGKCHMI